MPCDPPPMRCALLLSMALVGCAAAPSPLRSTTSTSKQAHARACESASDCVLAPRSCCGACGSAASGDARAIPRGSADAAHARRCAETACPACAAPRDPHLIATCSRAGTCGVLDLSTSEITACTTDADCTVRPRGCCACGAHEWVAINARSHGAYARRVCEPIVRCLACVGDAPPTTAVCRAHHCALATESGD
jgi:hypothetical protein